MSFVNKAKHAAESCCGYHKPKDRKEKKLSEKRLRSILRKEQTERERDDLDKLSQVSV